MSSSVAQIGLKSWQFSFASTRPDGLTAGRALLFCLWGTVLAVVDGRLLPAEMAHAITSPDTANCRLMTAVVVLPQAARAHLVNSGLRVCRGPGLIQVAGDRLGWLARGWPFDAS